MSTRVGTRAFFIAGVVICLVVAGLLSLVASGHPDGLEFVADQTGFLGAAEDSATAGSLFADYQTRGVEDARLSGALAGVAGVAVMLLVSGVLFGALRRRRAPASSAQA